MTAAGRIIISFLLMLHSTRGNSIKHDDATTMFYCQDDVFRGGAQNLFEDSSTSSNILLSSQSLVSLLLLALTVTLSGTVYLWILRYVCIGCIQPVAVGPESEALAVMV